MMKNKTEQREFNLLDTTLFKVAKSNGFATLSLNDEEELINDFREEIVSLSANMLDNNHLFREINCAITELEIIASEKKYSHSAYLS